MEDSAQKSLLTRVELARAFSVNAITITKWQHDGLPVAQRGGPGRESKYDLAACLAWWQARQIGKYGTGSNGAPLSLEVERAKLARAQTEKAELDAQARRGGLLPRADVAEAWSAIVGAVRQKLLAIPRAIAPQLAVMAEASAVEAALRAKIHEALSDLAVPSKKKRKTA